MEAQDTYTVEVTLSPAGDYHVRVQRWTESGVARGHASDPVRDEAIREAMRQADTGLAHDQPTPVVQVVPR